MARNDGIDRTVARNQDVETADDLAKVQEHNEREKDSYLIITEMLLNEVPCTVCAIVQDQKVIELRLEPSGKKKYS